MTRMSHVSKPEFIAGMGMMMALVAFSIDSVLPGMGTIGLALSPQDPSAARWVVTSFVLGLGLGTLVTGALSDAFGRRPVMFGGAVVYVVGAAAAALSSSLEMLLLSRALMGLGAAGPRVVTMAVIRDLYSGRSMAQLLSLVNLVFTLVPAIAPSIGALIIAFYGWRGVFVACVVFVAAISIWFGLRQPETLAPEHRRPLQVSRFSSAVVELVSNMTVVRATLTQMLVFGMLFTMLSTAQLIFDGMFGQGDTFHFWFGGMAVVSSSASVINAKLVVRLGMRAMIRAVLIAQVALSLVMVLSMAGFDNGPLLFSVFVIWTTSQFFMAGMTMGNLNALALEPMGHIAGMAASVISSVATVGAVAIAGVIGAFFDGTPLYLAVGTMICALLGLALMHGVRRFSPDES